MYYKNSSKITLKIKRHKHNINLRKHKKRSGFTLIELIAVMAIIGILATILLPQVTGYINEAKKTKVVDQCRKVVMAAESYGLKHKTLEKSIDVDKMRSKPGVAKYLEGVSLNNLPGSTTLEQCNLILQGAEFELEVETEMLKNTNIIEVNEHTKTKTTSKSSI